MSASATIRIPDGKSTVVGSATAPRIRPIRSREAPHQLGAESDLADRGCAAERPAAVHSGFFVAGAGERHIVITVATAGAIVICAAVIVVFSFRFAAPWSNCRTKSRVSSLGDLDASVNFADRNDEIGDLGRDFNEMVAQLKASREEIHRLHQTQMSRAEHFATLGELAAGLAHEIRNPLAGIAGVIEIVSRDLPPDSAARAVIKDAKEEAIQINRILTDLLETARPKPPQFQVKRHCCDRGTRGHVCAAAGDHKTHHDRTAMATTSFQPSITIPTRSIRSC